MGFGPDLGGDFLEVLLHGGGVAALLDDGGGDAALGTNGAEDVGRPGALVMRGAGPGAAPGLMSGMLVLLPDAGFILPPDLYPGTVGERLSGLRDQLGKFF